MTKNMRLGIAEPPRLLQRFSKHKDLWNDAGMTMLVIIGGVVLLLALAIGGAIVAAREDKKEE